MKHYFSDIWTERSSFLLLVRIKVQLEVFITCFRASDNKRRIFLNLVPVWCSGIFLQTIKHHWPQHMLWVLQRWLLDTLRALLRVLQWLWGVWKNKNFLDINAHWYKRCHIKLLQSQQVNICADILSWKAAISSSAHTPVPGSGKHTHCVQVCAYMDFFIILQPL